ncbi:MAG: ring-opening amidohydrolase [Xanthobacteraceae bacterium]
MSVDVKAFDMRTADDLSGLEAALAAAGADGIRRLALLMRVAGEYTDGSREKARAAIAALLARRNLSDKTQYVTVIGAEGASTPCGYAFIDSGNTGSRSGPRRLALGIARAASPPEETIGTAAHALAVKAAVEAGMNDAGMQPADAQVVIVNVPQPTSGDVGLRGRKGRAAAALGAGLALGEIAQDQVRDNTIVSDGFLYTSRVQTFTGPAIADLEVIVVGNAPGGGGDLVACNTLTTDLLDMRSVKRMLVKAGLPLDRDGELDTSRLVATLAKLGVDPSGRVSGAPTTIFGSATPPEKHVRAALSGALGATLHTTRLFSTFDPVQQAPVGGGTVCCIIRDAAQS